MAGSVYDGALRLTEERLARVSVLQELTVAALDLFDPRRSMDDFLDRLAVRLGCMAALCLGDNADSENVRLLGAAGLSRPSRALVVGPPRGTDFSRMSLPFPELQREGLVRWHFRVAPPEGPRRMGSALLLVFEGGPQLPAQYHGVVERLADILRTALLHRQLYARTIENERRLYEQKTLLECQSEASLDGVLFVSVDGSASFNRRFEELFGQRRGESRSAREVLRVVASHVVSPQGIEAMLERQLVSKEEQSRVQVRTRDGKVFELACVPIKGDQGVCYGRGWYFRDVSAQIRGEEERAQLLEQEQAARAQAEEAQRRAAFVADASRILGASLDYAATLERVAHLALPDFADWCVVDLVEDRKPRRVAVAHVDPGKTEVAERLRTRYSPDLTCAHGIPRVLREGKPLFIAEMDETTLREISQDEEHERLLREMGIASVVVVPLTARGRQLGAFTLAYGSSGRRYRQADLALAEDLACRAALAVDNARLYARREEAVRARDEFLSIASHELRTPVTSLQLATQGLLRLARSGSFEKAPLGFIGTSLETAVRQSTRMAQLIDRLLDVSRIQAGKMELQLEEVDLAVVAREIVEHLREDLHNAGCALVLSLEPVRGRWDRSRLEQVVANLLSNAIKYGAGKPIELRVEADGAIARLVVADQGIGIPVERQHRIFERFERGVSSLHYSGLGLGLYIVRRVLLALDGTIKVHSQLGSGTTFTVELPVAGPQGFEGEPDPEKRGAA